MRKQIQSALDKGVVQRLNMVEMGDRFSSKDCILVPCARDEGKDAPNGFNHSITAQFCVENKPLKVQTLVSIGSKSKLKSYLKSRLGMDLVEDEVLGDMFNGSSGLTFPCSDDDGASYVVIWMPKFDWSISDLETLDHETIHATVMAMRMSGVRAKIFSAKKDVDVDDEGLAYAKSSMFSAILKELAKRQHSMFRKSASSKVV